MNEIISQQTVDKLFLALAFALPLIGLALGAMRKRPLIGFLWGLLGPANLILWKIYNLITGRYGLDTMRNLYVNLALFAGLGLVVGWIVGRKVNKPSN